MIKLKPPHKLTAQEIAAQIDSYEFRREVGKTLAGFCLIYLPHHFQLEPPEYQPEMMNNLDNPELRHILVEGFRGGTKSTVGSLALPLHAALVHPDRYPFILPVADTSLQASINIANIKTELDNNMLIKQDFGNIKGDFVEAWDLEGEEDWQAKNMLLANGVRILARSRGQKVRGLRHREHRPKLAAIDDPEDLEWVKTREKRDKTEKWLRGELLPAMDEKNGRVVILANRLHNDSLAGRLENDPLFFVMKYPIIKAGPGTEWDRCVWKAKYPTPASIEKQKLIAGPSSWQREYMLQPVPDEGQEVTEADIQYYDKMPVETELGVSGTAIDLAISKKTTADYTAGVSGKTAEVAGHFQIYIQPNPIHGRFDLNELKQILIVKSQANPLELFWVESVAYQQAAIDEFQRALLPVEAIQAIGDKRARLKIAAQYIKNGTVLFPRHGCEDLIAQLLNFGSDDHDDLVDALAYVILELVKQGARTFQAVGI